MFKCVRNFSRYSTIHGIRNIGLSNLHVIERLFWIIIIGIAVFYAIYISNSNCMRYMANPTVVSLQKDFRNWDNPFPALTACFVSKIDINKAKKYIYQQWGITENSPQFDYFMSFVHLVANMSFENLENFKSFAGEKKFENIDLTDLATKVYPNLSDGLVTFDPSNPVKWTITLSELGVCFSVNSKFAHLMATNYTNNNPNQRILKCHYLNGLCYARYDSDPQRPLRLYVHSYLEVPLDIDSPLIVVESQELDINFRMQETTASMNLRLLNPIQRKCRFFDEPLHTELPYYSRNICYITCRYKMLMKYCGCKPIFYHYFGGRNCTISDLLCVARYSKELTKSPKHLGCKCPPACDTITYFPEIPKYTKWEYGYFEQRITFRWGLLHPTTKYRRDVLFGFEDLVVSIGGTYALFLGVSFISLIEVIYLIFENLFMLV